MWGWICIELVMTISKQQHTQTTEGSESAINAGQPIHILSNSCSTETAQGVSLWHCVIPCSRPAPCYDEGSTLPHCNYVGLAVWSITLAYIKVLSIFLNTANECQQ